jgi:hypothetical protein
VFAVEKDTAHDRVRLLVGDQQILGALVMGDQTLSRPLQHLIAEEVDIRSIRGELMSQPAQLVSLIERLWAETQASVNAR